MTSTELVWDTGCTATASSGASRLVEGPEADWDASLLLATAAGASLLAAFLKLARDPSVLGYTAQQSADIDTATDAIVRVVLKVCIVVASPASVAAADTALTRALELAPVIQALACPVHCERSIVVLEEQDLARACN